MATFLASRERERPEGPPVAHAPGSPLLVLRVAGAEHLLQRGDPFQRLLDAVLEQGAHAGLARPAADGLRRLPLERHVPNGVGHAHQLEDALAAAVAGVVAVLA